MKKIKMFFGISALLLGLWACHNDLVPESEMVGVWECVDIQSKANANPPLKDIVFDFKADSTYTLGKSLQNIDQRGSWYTLEDRLYTHPEGGSLMFVKLDKSGPDTLRFLQNRGGFAETWVMVRRK